VKIRRLLVALVAAVTLAAPISIAPAVLGGTNPIAYGPCQTTFAQNQFAGYETTSPTANRTGVMASIKIASPADGFRPCSWTVGNDGSFAWIGLQSAVSDGDNDAEIVQIGIGRCNNLAFGGTCLTNEPRFFWAVGGCNEDADAKDLGPADLGSHNYKIRTVSITGGAKFVLSIDGVDRREISLDDPDISCWAWGNRSAAWLFEKLDRGDGIGGIFGPSWMSWMHYQITRDGPWWRSPMTADSPCIFQSLVTPGGMYCEVLSDGKSIRAWSEY
jgi:hypothetical protein